MRDTTTINDCGGGGGGGDHDDEAEDNDNDRRREHRENEHDKKDSGDDHGGGDNDDDDDDDEDDDDDDNGDGDDTVMTSTATRNRDTDTHGRKHHAAKFYYKMSVYLALRGAHTDGSAVKRRTRSCPRAAIIRERWLAARPLAAATRSPNGGATDRPGQSTIFHVNQSKFHLFSMSLSRPARFYSPGDTFKTVEINRKRAYRSFRRTGLLGHLLVFRDDDFERSQIWKRLLVSIPVPFEFQTQF